MVLNEGYDTGPTIDLVQAVIANDIGGVRSAIADGGETHTRVIAFYDFGALQGDALVHACFAGSLEVAMYLLDWDGVNNPSQSVVTGQLRKDLHRIKRSPEYTEAHRRSKENTLYDVLMRRLKSIEDDAVLRINRLN